MRFGEVIVVVGHLHEVYRGAWVNYRTTLKTFRKADIEFIEKLSAFLLTKVIDIIIRIGAQLDKLLVWREVSRLDVGTSSECACNNKLTLFVEVAAILPLKSKSLTQF